VSEYVCAACIADPTPVDSGYVRHAARCLVDGTALCEKHAMQLVERVMS
jgi:hypothetical protein